MDPMDSFTQKLPQQAASMNTGISGQPMAMSPPIIVVGCPRSGTSLFAKLLVAAGLRTVVDERSGEKYPSGYFEHMPLLFFHKAMERYPRSDRQGRADHAVALEEFLKVEYLRDPIVRAMFETAFEPLLDKRVDFIKYPQLALSPEFLLETIPQVHLIALWRNPEANIRSLAHKEFQWDMIPFRGVRSVMLWGMYAHHVCRAKELAPDRVTVLAIDALIKANAGVGPLLRSLGYDAADTRVGEVTEPGLWHNSESLANKFYLRSLGHAIRVVSARRSGPEAGFADLRGWQERLEKATDQLPSDMEAPAAV